MKMALIRALLIIVFAWRTLAGLLQSPCPGIFEYRHEYANHLYGFLRVECPYDNSVVQLNVEISVGNRVQGFNGNIELAQSKSQTVNDLLNHRNLQYRLDFPYWNAIPPKVTSITVNGNPVCYGYPMDNTLVPFVTTIRLQHTLKLDAPVHVAPDMHLNPEWQYKETPSVTPQARFDAPHMRPHPKTATNQPIHFNPQPPRDPSKMYTVNPFFTSSSTERAPPAWPANGFRGGSFNPKGTNPHSLVFPTSRSASTDLTTAEPPPVAPSIDVYVDEKPRTNNCGTPFNGNELILSGERIRRGAHPWLAALFLQTTSGLEFKCGATLVSHRHVITAAHCVKHRKRNVLPEELLVVLGRENIKRWGNDGAQIIEIQAVHVNADYKSHTADADVAVAVLSEEALFTRFVRPACLWQGDDDLDAIVGVRGTVIGWGRDERGNLVSPTPKEVTIPVVSQEQCLRSNETFREITSFRTFCAGYRNNSGPCNGDSGGGFLMLRSGRWSLRGVVSMSLLSADNTCDLHHYVVFTDVSKFHNWIHSIIG